MTGEVDVLAVMDAVLWEDVFKTFGSCHSTLLGAFVQAWNRSAKDRFALESGCSPTKGHAGSHFCDAILCNGDYANPTPIGILEVEGKPFPKQKLESDEPARTIFERMRSYWFPVGEKAQYFRYFGNLSFAVLIVYPFGPDDGKYAETEEKVLSEGRAFLERVKDARPDFRLFAVVVHKCKERSIEGSIRLNPYYQGTISKVEWFEITRAGTRPETRNGKVNPLAVG